MKLLITGGTGFLGRRAAAYFEKQGWEVFTPGHNRLDITDPSAIERWLWENTPDAVIHTAAISDTGLCQQRPEWSEEINVTGCVRLAKACRETGAKLAICSSDQVYFGSKIAGPHCEDEILSPGNVYGAQKLRAEQQCLDIYPETVCLRLSWMYAQRSLPGEHSHFLAALKASLADNTREITWPVYDRRGLTDVEYVIKNLPKALLLPGGVWNFGSDNDCSTYETVKTLLEEKGLEEALQRLKPNLEAFVNNPRDISMDLTKLKTAGLYFPTTQEGLQKSDL